MSFSKVEICNMALAKAGATQPIHSLEYSGSDAVPQEARLCSLYYPLAWEATARSHDWGCLSCRASLPLAAATPAWGYAYAYQLPADYVGWLRFETGDVAHKRIGRQIHTDESPANVQYVARTDDTDRLDALFVEALVMRLAAHLVPCFGGDEQYVRQAQLRKWHESVDLPRAIAADAAESGPVVIESATWREARR